LGYLGMVMCYQLSSLFRFRISSRTVNPWWVLGAQMGIGSVYTDDLSTGNIYISASIRRIYDLIVRTVCGLGPIGHCDPVIGSNVTAFTATHVHLLNCRRVAVAPTSCFGSLILQHWPWGGICCQVYHFYSSPDFVINPISVWCCSWFITYSPILILLHVLGSYYVNMFNVTCIHV
jgi:hypothetical protein